MPTNNPQADKRQAQKARDKRDRETLKQAAKAGVYGGDPNAKITPARAKKAADLRRQYGADNMDPAKTIIARTYRDVPKSVAQAKKAGLSTTDKAVFIPRDGGTTSARLVYDERDQEFIVRERIKRETATGSRTISRSTPLIVGDDDEKAQARIKREIRKAGKLRPNERLVYRLDLHEQGTGYGQYTFGGDDLEDMDEDELEEYMDALYKEIFGEIRKRYAGKSEVIMPTVSVEKVTVKKHAERMNARDQRAKTKRNLSRAERRRIRIKGR